MQPGMPYIRTRRLTILLVSLLISFIAGNPAQAHHTDSHFEESSKHRIVYQLNKADPTYLQHVLFSAGELLRKYGVDIEIIIAAFGPGLHLIGRHPERPIPAELQQRASSLAAYGVAFHACGNTMKSLGWTEKDLFEFAKIVPIGVDDIMQLQEQGFTYMSW
jgi:intracellular sulfur oxidation DsrE/DsrF family protein